MLETDTHVYFWGTKNDQPFYSNFYITDVAIKLSPNAPAIVFRSSEHAFMALKAMAFNDFQVVQEVIKVVDPKDAKAFGRAVMGFDEDTWAYLSPEAMYTVCLAKFMQNRDIQDKLLATGNKILVEGSPGDKIWGVGLRWDDPKILDKANWRGQNRLGRILMMVRWDIRQYLAHHTNPHFKQKAFDAYA